MSKRLLSIFLVVLMSIESFAAVVSDNDGAAFITKAEFDSLKNDFQSQINRYNESIDNKIDGAIASYLAGVNIAKTETKTIITKDWGEYTIMNGAIANTYVYPSADIQISIFNDYSTEGQTSISSGSRKVMWANGHVSVEGSGNYNKKVLVTNVDVGETLGIDNMTWYGVAENMKESWSLASQWIDTIDDPGYLYSPALNYIWVKFCTITHLNGRDGYIERFGDKTKPIWKPTFYWQGARSSSEIYRYKWTKAEINTISETPTVEYKRNTATNKIFSYEHLGNWKADTSWEVNVKDELHYLTVSPNNENTSKGWFSTTTTSGNWSAMEVNGSGQFEGMGRRKSTKFTDALNNASATETADPVGIPTIGLLPNTYSASVIYQFDKLVDSDGNAIPKITLEKGLPLMHVRQGEMIVWEPVFKVRTVPGVTGDVEMKIVLSYKPFSNGANTYTTGSTQNNDDYVKFDGFEKGTFPTTMDGKVKLSFQAEREGYIYAKWFPNISDSDIELKAWEATLDIDSSNTYLSKSE